MLLHYLLTFCGTVVTSLSFLLLLYSTESSALYVYSRPLVHYFCQIFQALCLFPAIGLFRTLEYIYIFIWGHFMATFCLDQMSIKQVLIRSKLFLNTQSILIFWSMTFEKVNKTGEPRV
jgi:hypothetical protein